MRRRDFLSLIGTAVTTWPLIASAQKTGGTRTIGFLGPLTQFAMSSWTAAYVEAGGLMSYGPNFPDLFRRAAEMVDKILRGAKPMEIPVEQPTWFDLVISLKTAKALGLEVTPTLLARADEVIE